MAIPMDANDSRGANVAEMTLGAAFPGILAAAQTGAEWAVTALYQEYDPALVRYLRARAGQDGEDVAAETWLDAARNLAGFSGDEERFRRWLYTIANRRVTDWLRRGSRRPVAFSSQETLATQIDGGDTAELALGRLDADDIARRIATVLPPAQAEIVLLRVVVGLTVDEVAEVTGRRPGTVRVMAHRALRRLAQELSEDV
ncbi:MAG: RNA polymerase sigma factor [Acidimicrobiales bacterium]